MELKDFLSLAPEHHISAADAQSLNTVLSLSSINDIPHGHHIMVRDYLLCALNAGAVEPSLLLLLEKLRIDLDDAISSQS